MKFSWDHPFGRSCLVLFLFKMFFETTIWGKFVKEVYLILITERAGCPHISLIGDKRIMISENLVFQLSREYINKVNRLNTACTDTRANS